MIVKRTPTQELDWVTQHHYLGPVIPELKNAEIKKALSFVAIACYFWFVHVNFNTCPLAETIDAR